MYFHCIWGRGGERNRNGEEGERDRVLPLTVYPPDAETAWFGPGFPCGWQRHR